MGTYIICVADTFAMQMFASFQALAILHHNSMKLEMFKAQNGLVSYVFFFTA